jgi:hypothetical protein
MRMPCELPMRTIRAFMMPPCAGDYMVSTRKHAHKSGAPTGRATPPEPDGVRVSVGAARPGSAWSAQQIHSPPHGGFHMSMTRNVSCLLTDVPSDVSVTVFPME